MRSPLILTSPSTQGSQLPMSPVVTLDDRFRAHWERGQAARARARRSLPLKWLNDPRPEMHDVCELYVELMAQELIRRPGQASRQAAT